MRLQRGSRSIEAAGWGCARRARRPRRRCLGRLGRWMAWRMLALRGRRLCLGRAGLWSRLWSPVWLGLRSRLRRRSLGSGRGASPDGVTASDPDGRAASSVGGRAVPGDEHATTPRLRGGTAARAKRRAASHRNETRSAPARRTQHGGEQRSVLPARLNLVPAVFRDDRRVLRGRAGSLTQPGSPAGRPDQPARAGPANFLKDVAPEPDKIPQEGNRRRAGRL
jgi:hypothetical protein